ncbi:hypothetical protein ABK040_003687 [Willaertia magna]
MSQEINSTIIMEDFQEEERTNEGSFIELIPINNDKENKQFETIILTKEEPELSIGRKPEFKSNCKFKDPKISTLHCTLKLHINNNLIEHLTVTDKSSNGCYLNEKRIEKNKEIILKDGDLLGLSIPNISHKFSKELPIYRVHYKNFIQQDIPLMETQLMNETQLIDDVMADEVNNENQNVSLMKDEGETIVPEEENNNKLTDTSTSTIVFNATNIDETTLITTPNKENKQLSLLNEEEEENKRKRKEEEIEENKTPKKSPKRELTEKEKKIALLFGSPNLFDNSQDENDEKDEEMIRELTCPICSEIFYKPVSIVPCLHNFCSSCISNWINPDRTINVYYSDNNLNCPTCRTKILEVRKNPQLNNLTESFLKNHSSKELSKEEKEAKDKEDKFNGKNDLVLYKCHENNRNNVDDESDDEEEEEESEESDDDNMGGRCEECTQTSAIDGFRCPNHALHVSCYNCGVLMAHRLFDTTLNTDRRQSCELCNGVYCNLYKQITNTASGCFIAGIHKLKEHVNMAVIPLGCLNNNSYERDILVNYVQSKSLTVDQLYNTCVDKFESGEYTTTQYPSLTSNSKICRSCAMLVFSDLLYCYRANIPNTELPQSVTSRPNCWYGKECRTQTHNRGHSQRYNHICDNVSHRN